MNPVDRFLQRRMFNSNPNNLDYLIQQFSCYESTNKNTRLVSNITYIYLYHHDYHNGLEWLGHWNDLEPENTEVHEMIEHFEYFSMDYKRKERDAKQREKDEVVEKGKAAKSSYFTMKNLLLLGLAVWGFSYLKNIK